MASETPSGMVSAATAALPVREPYAVGIGASAGGLDALRTLFGCLPPAPGMSFVVVVHLSPEHESHLVELLQPCTPMPVRQVTETCPLQPNHVYVIPPNANLSAIDTHLRLSKLEERRRERAPIDHFFRTLAATHDGRSVGVILTGGGSDGALGLRQIKEHGGLTIAQDPDEAEHGSMPRSAIATGMVDVIAPLGAIADEIVRFCATEPRLPVPGRDGTVDDTQEALLAQIEERVRLHTGQDVTVYKRETLLRWIRRRMQLRHVDTLAGYLAVLSARAAEPRALADDLLSTVTEFFRDPVLFDQLERHVLPRLFDTKAGEGDRVRVWSIGCSTGEEAYSLAMLLIEEASRRAVRPQLQVFASDQSGEVLSRAREGRYPREVEAQVSPERVARFFVDEGAQYRVRPEVRDIVVFAEQNVFRDPPYSHLDLIVCRSVLRDLQPQVRRAVVSRFYYSLEPHGALVVGANDALDEPDLFVCEDERARVFRRRAIDDTKSFDHLALRRQERAGASAAAERRDREREIVAIHDRLAERLAPPSVLVDADNQVVHYSPRAGEYVRLPGGDPTRDLTRLVAEPLRSTLRAGLVAARAEGRPWRSDAIEVRTYGGVRSIALRVEPAAVSERPGMVAVAFDDRGAPESSPRAASTGDDTAIAVIAHLKEELERAHARVRAFVEADDHSSALKSSHEELQGANEELRFILEELEGSKEELQAANEELVTVDVSNRRRIDELAELSADLKHLLESTGVGTLFLDRRLNIVRFTPQITELFHVQHSDRGRPLTDITHRLRYDELAADARGVLESLTPADREVETKDGQRWYLTRILPYRTATDDVDGVVVAFVDITARRRAEQRLRDADRRKDEFLALLAHELRNPLAPIAAGIEILRASGNDPRIIAQVSAIMARQVAQLVRLVDDLLDVSRISGGRLRLQRTRVQLAEIIRDAVAAVQPVMDAAGHKLTVSVPDEPIMLDADATRLVQVFGNLLNNAARYTPKEGRIELTASRESEAAVVVVRDTGIGIADDLRGRVFEMFFQANDRRQARNAGLGIGLTLAKSLVEMHGGSIAVASDGVDRGSEFTVRLPIAAAAEQAADVVTRLERSDLARHRILIVDDNADAAHTLSLLVRNLGDNEVRTAGSGSEGLELAYDFKPDIVLLDLKMPGMDGYEVARRLRQQPGGAAMRIVALTGWGQDDHKRRTKEAGFERHLTKPADRAAIAAVLAGSAAAQAPAF
jgi:two-component system CheB/CheR fusion protein